MRSFTRSIRLLVCSIGLIGISASAVAQETTGSISGTVVDASGATVKGAVVTLINTDRGAVERTLKTSGAGFYTATSLPLGTYTVKVAAPGFKTESETGLVLNANDALTANEKLVPGAAGEVVTVTADPVQLNLEDATSAGLITGDQLNELVLNNRNYEQFLQLQPGVAYGGANDQLYVGPTAPAGMSNTVAFSVNGGRSTSNNWTVDGADNLDRGANLTTLVYPSIDAIAEVKTLRGQYSAEYGRSASGQVNVITKSGQNSIHGTLYEFWRNNILNANTWGNKNIANPASFTPRPVLRYNDFGGTFGGPVVIPHLYNGRDKTFFFFSDEARRVIQYVNGTAVVPTAAERAGNFTNEYYQSSTGAWSTGPVNVCTAYSTANPGTCTAVGTQVNNISTASAAYLKDLYALVPLPPSVADIASGLDPHDIVSTASNQFNDNQIIVRIDQKVGSKLNVFYRYIHDSLPVISGTGTFTTVPLPGIATTTTKQPGTIHMGHGTYLFSPTLLLDMGYAYSSGAINTTPIGSLTSANSPDVVSAIALPYVNQLGVIPTLAMGNYTSLGSTGIYNDYNKNHNAFGSVTKTLNTHTLIAGFSYDHYQKRENATGGNQGSFAFTNPATTLLPTPTGVASTSLVNPQSFANFLLGNVNNGFSQSSLAITPDIQENVFEGFVQDNWKATRRLTLNVGVRYSYFGQPIDAGGRLNNFDPATYTAAGAPTISSTGLICFTGPCTNADGLNSGVPNPGADFIGVNYINGLIFANPNSSNNNQKSPFGSKVGTADNDNLAPRFGFAYDLTGDGKTALRGGYGWSFDESEVSYYESLVFYNPPAVTTYSTTYANLGSPSGTLSTTPSTTPGKIYGSPINYHTPYVQQYSLDLQHEFAPTLMLDVGYFGTHGTHLLGLVNIDEPTAGSYVNANGTYKVNPLDNGTACEYPGTTTPAFISTTCDRALNQIRPYLGYVDIDAVRSIFSSNYSALQVKATKRFRGDSMFDANYTWSRDLTNNQNDYSTPPQNTSNINADYGRAAIDRTNILTFDWVYASPFFKEQHGLKGHILGGWETSGIYTMNSGLPLTVTESAGSAVYYGYTNPLNGQANGNYVSDAGGIGISGPTNASYRPSMIGDPNSGYGQQIHTKNQWFYRGAFATPLPQTFQVGNEKRGVINGPGFIRLDLGVFRNFKIREGLNFQLRGEAFNALNHTNYQTVNVTATSTAFGQVSAARDNRIMQIAGKIRF